MITGVPGVSDVGGRRDRTDQVGSDRIEAISSVCWAGREPDEEDRADLVLCIPRRRFGRPSFLAANAQKSRELRRRHIAPSILYAGKPTDRHGIYGPYVCSDEVRKWWSGMDRRPESPSAESADTTTATTCGHDVERELLKQLSP